MQDVALVQLTDINDCSVELPILSGAVTMLHAVPLHCSMRFWSVPDVNCSPTATQNVVLTQLIPEKKSSLLAFGVVTCAQWAPFHSSASVSAAVPAGS